MLKLSASILAVAALACVGSATPAREPARWMGTWASSPAGMPTVAKVGTWVVPVSRVVKGTVRYRLRISRGGRQIRLRFSNEYGEGPLTLSAATVGLAGVGLDASPGSLRKVTFGGAGAIVVPAGAPALSDPIDLPVKDLGDLIVSIYLSDGIPVCSCTADEAPADQAAAEGLDATLIERLPKGGCFFTMRPLISEVDVLMERPGRVVVAFGDSITDGSLDPGTGERGWPGVLSRRLRHERLSVVNAGIGGNRLLQSMPMFGSAALARFDRDVLRVPGLSDIVLLEGINDLAMSGPGGVFGDSSQVRPPQLTFAYGQIIARAHERGVRVFGATLLPFAGSPYYTQEREAVRQSVNQWIRTSHEFDGVVDFDVTVRDPSNPSRLRPEFDSGDHLHPNSAGYTTMAQSIDPHLFN